MAAALRQVTFVESPGSPAASLAAALARIAPAATRVRTVAADQLIGRDLRESDRLLAAPAVLATAHLRELFAQRRAHTVALVGGGGAAAAVEDDAVLALLRRHSGRVIVDDPRAAATMRVRVLQPVHVLAANDAAALWTILGMADGNDDSVAMHLVEARLYVQRGNEAAAFASAARALQQAPDQPGVIADVARLLSNLGEGERAVTLCRTFLRQGVTAEPVRAALAEIETRQR